MKVIITLKDSCLGLWNETSSFSGLGAGFVSSHVIVADFDDYENLNIHSYYNACLLFRQMYPFIAMFRLSRAAPDPNVKTEGWVTSLCKSCSDPLRICYESIFRQVVVKRYLNIVNAVTVVTKSAVTHISSSRRRIALDIGIF